MNKKHKPFLIALEPGKKWHGVYAKSLNRVSPRMIQTEELGMLLAHPKDNPPIFWQVDDETIFITHGNGHYDYLNQGTRKSTSITGKTCFRPEWVPATEYDMPIWVTKAAVQRKKGNK